MPDFAARRTMMVDNQVRPSDVTKLPIIKAMLNVPRERYVPGALSEAAYVGETLDLGNGRVLLEPRTLAKMLDALNLSPRDLVLDIAAGLGYGAAVMARMAEAVIAVESEEAMADDAEAALQTCGATNVVFERGAPSEGAAEHGPYDAIIIEGGIEAFPDALAGQLKEHGRVAAIFMSGALGTVRIGIKNDGKIHWRDAFNASAPVLPGFEAVREFAL